MSDGPKRPKLDQALNSGQRQAWGNAYEQVYFPASVVTGGSAQNSCRQQVTRKMTTVEARINKTPVPAVVH
ncbi:MAG: hypothetical protein OXE94_05165 [Aestuariivita sp.]|nr:hypothetical protein [Aestuariivita sp.]